MGGGGGMMFSSIRSGGDREGPRISLDGDLGGLEGGGA